MGVPLSTKYIKGSFKVTRTVLSVLSEKSEELGVSKSAMMNFCLKYVGGLSVQANIARIFREHEARLGRINDEFSVLNTYYVKSFVPPLFSRKVSSYIECSVRYCFGLVVDEGMSELLHLFKPPVVSDRDCVYLITKRFSRKLREARCTASKKEKKAHCDKCLHFTARNGMGL